MAQEMLKFISRIPNVSEFPTISPQSYGVFYQFGEIASFLNYYSY